jgi:hypothetical protein
MKIISQTILILSFISMVFAGQHQAKNPKQNKSFTLPALPMKTQSVRADSNLELVGRWPYGACMFKEFK